MLYNVVLVYAVEQCKSAIILYTYTHTHTYISLPSLASLPFPISPPRSSQSTAGFPVSYINFSPVTYSVYIDAIFSICRILSFPHCAHKSILCISVSVSSLNRWSWISSLWSEMKCPVMSYEMSMGLV